MFKRYADYPLIEQLKFALPSANLCWPTSQAFPYRGNIRVYISNGHKPINRGK